MEKGFDWVWNVVPQLSAYQLFIAIVSGYVAFIGNISWRSEFDTNKLFPIIPTNQRIPFDDVVSLS